MKVLLLNNSYEVLEIIQGQRAVVLIMQQKATRPFDFVDNYEIKTVNSIFKLPTVLVLVTYARIPFKKIAVTKENVLKRDNYTCQYCGSGLTNRTCTIDHVIPRSKGGRHKWNNIVSACISCNNTKANKIPRQAGMKQPKLFTPTRGVLIMTMIDPKTKEKWTRWLIK